MEVKRGSGRGRDEDGRVEEEEEEGVGSGPPVARGQPGLMSKANMMLTFLQGSAV